MEADPREPVYPRNLGGLYRELKRSEEAEQWYRKALEVDGNYAPAYNGLGVLYKEQKRFDEAESQYRRAMEGDPREPVYPRNLGDLYLELKRSEEAEQCYRKAFAVCTDGRRWAQRACLVPI